MRVRHGIGPCLALALLAGCHLIFPFQVTGADGAATDGAAADGRGTDGAADLPRPDLKGGKDAQPSPDLTKPLDVAPVCPAVCTNGCSGKICELGACNAIGGNCTCPPGWPCRVLCQTAFSCLSTINCTAASSCEVQCTGDNSCNGTITCGDNPCTVKCDGAGACAGTINCPTSKAKACVVSCGGVKACPSNINCGAGRCTVLCYNQSCANIYCQSSCACMASCTSAGTCTGTVLCPGGCNATTSKGCTSKPVGCDTC